MMTRLGTSTCTCTLTSVHIFMYLYLEFKMLFVLRHKVLEKHQVQTSTNKYKQVQTSTNKYIVFNPKLYVLYIHRIDLCVDSIV